MEVEGKDITGAPMKRGMGISAAPEKYQPASPRYIRPEESSEDEENDQDEEEGLEAPYLAPKSALPQDQHRVKNLLRYQQVIKPQWRICQTQTHQSLYQNLLA